MATTDATIQRYVDVALGRTSKSNYVRYPRRGNNVFAEGDQLFSYGYHFEMARAIRDRKGAVSHWLVNGDTFSVTTSKHQSVTRGALHRSGLPVVIIPYSALSQAGIDRDSVRILEVTPDKMLTREVVEHEFPAGASWHYETAVVPGTSGYLHSETGEFIDYHLRERRVNLEVGRYRHGKEKWADYYALRQAAEQRWVEVPAQIKRTGRKSLLIRAGAHTEWELFDDGGQLAYRRTISRHLLGQSLITARVAGRKRPVRFLSGFDANETRPSYFFCELPRTSKALTVEQALADLKPATVVAAEQLGRDVKRQGDIFAIPLPSLTKRELTKAGAAYVKGGHLFNTNHVATELATLADGTTLVRGTLKHDPIGRRPDHKRVGLGQSWHVALKNTVPVTA